jgi:hypothetical protein
LDRLTGPLDILAKAFHHLATGKANGHRNQHRYQHNTFYHTITPFALLSKYIGNTPLIY